MGSFRIVFSLRARALGVYAALALPIAALVHVGLEVAVSPSGTGSVFTLRHGLLGLVVALVLAVTLRRSGLIAAPADRKRNARLLAAALPARGRGAGFLTATVVAEFGFVIATMLLEGTLPDPASSAAALACAAAALVIASCLVWAHRARVVATFGVHRTRAVRGLRTLRRGMRARVLPRAGAAHFALFVPNRPPPHLRVR